MSKHASRDTDEGAAPEPDAGSHASPALPPSDGGTGKSGAIDADAQTVIQWSNAVHIAHLGHIESAKASLRRHRLLGGIAAALGGICASAVFANIRDSPRLWVQVLAGTTVVAALSVGILTTFLNYAARAASHQSAATGYGGLRREMEQRRLTHAVDAAFLDRFRIEWTRLDRHAPTMPPRIYDRAFAKVLKRNPPPDAPRTGASALAAGSDTRAGASPS
jgi:hypothetical protein